MSRTVIVFLEDCILAAAGKEGRYPELQRVERVRLKGQGDSFEQWQQALQSLPAEWKTGQLHLVLPVSMCAARVLKLPYSRGRQLAEMAVREVADSFRSEIADYSVIYSDKKDGVEICAGGADSGQLKRFVNICKEAGFSVGCATVFMEGFLGVLQQLESYWNSTAIYLFFEEGSMTSVLCQNGHYLYSGRSRIFSEPGTVDFGTEIVRSISGILQFYVSGKSEISITDVYFAGCEESDFEVSVEGIKALGLKAGPLVLDKRISLPAGQRASDWLPCIGAMIYRGKKEKQINLYREDSHDSEKGEKTQEVWKHLLVPFAVFVLCLIPIIVVAFLNLGVSHQNARKQDWIASDEVQKQYGYALGLEERLSAIEGSIAAVSLTDRNLSTYPEVTPEVLRKIEYAGGAGIQCRITGYDASTGVLTFEAGSREVIDVPSYILKLQESGLFHYVDYMGYTYENEWYTLTLSCAMEGKNVQEVDV